MLPEKPAFSLGVEEEYLLVDPDTRDLASRPPRGFMQRCEKALGPRVAHEFPQSQVEVGTSVCADAAGVRDELVALRRAIAGCAGEFGLRMIAASTHPWAVWHSQMPVEMERYRILTETHQGLARRMVICGTHVHAGIEDPRLRIELMNQAASSGTCAPATSPGGATGASCWPRTSGAPSAGGSRARSPISAGARWCRCRS